MNMWKECEALQDSLVKMRRELHQIPVLLQILPGESQERRSHSVQIWMHLPYRRQTM